MSAVTELSTTGRGERRRLETRRRLIAAARELITARGRFLPVRNPAGFEADFRLLADAAAVGQAPDPARLADVSTRVGLANV